MHRIDTFNDLTPAEAERLALLLEEMGEVQQAIGKVLRHGYQNYHPDDAAQVTNRDQLTRELGDVLAAIKLMTDAEDIYSEDMTKARQKKLKRVQDFMHHQREDTDA